MDESSAQWINLLISVNSIQKSSLSLQNAYKLEYSPCDYFESVRKRLEDFTEGKAN